MPECSHPKILFLVSLLFVALLNSIPSYLLNFEFFYSSIYSYSSVMQLLEEKDLYNCPVSPYGIGAVSSQCMDDGTDKLLYIGVGSRGAPGAGAPPVFTVTP